MSIETYPSFCLNCGAELSGDAKYCHITCKVAYMQKQLRAFNAEFKPALNYTEIDNNEN